MSSKQDVDGQLQSSKSVKSDTRKRIHLSGLNAEQCSLTDLQDRFKSFDLIVSDVYNWPPKPNAVDQPTDWCFLTVSGEDTKVKRAIGVLHGTMWKGKKLRVSQAKEREWQAKVDAEESKEKKAKKQKKRSKFIDGEESENVNTPITAKDVEDGEWGWKRTPAGHLIRPMYMRPDRPLPPPKIVQSEEDKKKHSRLKNSSHSSDKPLIRAKRVTIDPTRYGAVHLSELMLEDGSIDPESGCVWICDEEVEDGKAQWKLVDSSGNSIRTEEVSLRQSRKNTAEMEEVDGSSSVSDSNLDEQNTFDQVDAAIDQASYSSDSESSDHSEAEKELELPVPDAEEEEKMVQITYPHYDPEDEDAFSDGYQEIPTGQASSISTDRVGETSVQLALLQKMFGQKGLHSVDKPERKQSALYEDESSEDGTEENDGEMEEISIDVVDVEPSKPNSLAMELDEQDQSQEGNIDDGPSADVKNTITQSDHVEMTTLTDMFKPKSDKGGFSLMANLDLDLDEEFNFEPELEEGEEDFHTAYRVTNDDRQALPPSSVIQTSNQQYSVFPSLDSNGHIRFDGKDIFSVLARQLRQNDSNSPSFFDVDDAETVSKKWEERKSTLTQVYKRRHREALKKKKRKFVGSRAAGTALPGRKVA